MVIKKKYSCVKVDQQKDGITWVTFNRPEKRNAMSPIFHAEMFEILDFLETDPDTKLVILTGEGVSFSAGQDLKVFFRETDGRPDLKAAAYNNSKWRNEKLWMYNKPTISMVNGFCIGGAFTQCICSDFAIDRLDCDRARMGQLLSNLVSNAVTHGTPGIDVRIEAKVLDGIFRLTVSNGSPPIPAAILHGLFQPFSRGEDSKGSGIGLGLYIASEIARAHGGHLTAEMQDDLVIFTMTMPATATANEQKQITRSASPNS